MPINLSITKSGARFALCYNFSYNDYFVLSSVWNGTNYGTAPTGSAIVTPNNTATGSITYATYNCVAFTDDEQYFVLGGKPTSGLTYPTWPNFPYAVYKCSGSSANNYTFLNTYMLSGVINAVNGGVAIQIINNMIYSSAGNALLPASNNLTYVAPTTNFSYTSYLSNGVYPNLTYTTSLTTN
jgi:hypothetical protein